MVSQGPLIRENQTVIEGTIVHQLHPFVFYRLGHVVYRGQEFSASLVPRHHFRTGNVAGDLY